MVYATLNSFQNSSGEFISHVSVVKMHVTRIDTKRLTRLPIKPSSRRNKARVTLLAPRMTRGETTGLRLELAEMELFDGVYEGYRDRSWADARRRCRRE